MLVRVHSECLTGDVFHSLRCDCGEQLEQALARIADEERGVLLYMTQEGRGIGLLNKLKAYELQEAGLDTVEANLELGFPADARDYGIGNQILADLGLTTIRILTNNPKKLTGIEGFGLTVVEQVPIEIEPNGENRRYLETKRDKLGHRLHHQDLRFDREDEGRMSDARSTRSSRGRGESRRGLRRRGRHAEAPRAAGRRRERPAEPVAGGARAEPAAAARRGRAATSPTGYSVLAGERRAARRRAVARRRQPLQRRDHEPRCSSRRSTSSRRSASRRDAIMVMPVPGAFELPLAAMALAKTRRYACVVALGCVIRGETPHFDYVASEAASGLQLAALETGVPVSFGVLTVDTREQAEERIDRAADAVRTALEMADVFSQLRAQAAAARAERQRCRYIAARCRRSAPSAERSQPSGTTGATRWWPRSGASTRTSSASACSSTDGHTRIRLHPVP